VYTLCAVFTNYVLRSHVIYSTFMRYPVGADVMRDQYVTFVQYVTCDKYVTYDQYVTCIQYVTCVH